MSRYLLIGNPVMSAAETLRGIAEFDSIEEMQHLCDESLLDVPETINGCRFTFKVDTPLRNFNGPYRRGELRRLCQGKNLGGYWIAHGQCPGSMQPDEYACFASPAYLVAGEI